MDATPGEHWLPVVGYEGLYEVSDQGRVRGVDRVVKHYTGSLRLWKGQILAPQDRKYPSVHLSANGRSKSYCIHTLVLRAFRGDCPDGLQACHANDIRDDNRLENLRWDTREGNEQDKKRNGKWKRPKIVKTHCSKGHPFDEANTCISGGRWYCRTCARNRAAAKRQSRTAA